MKCVLILLLILVLLGMVLAPIGAQWALEEGPAFISDPLPSHMNGEPMWGTHKGKDAVFWSTLVLEGILFATCMLLCANLSQNPSRNGAHS